MPLSEAADPAIAMRLIAAGADINAQFNGGRRILTIDIACWRMGRISMHGPMPMRPLWILRWKT